MFTDPQSFKWDGTTAISLPRVGADLGSGRYRNPSFTGPGSADSTALLTIGQQYTKTRSRRTARMDVSWYDLSLISTTTKAQQGVSVYVVVDAPLAIAATGGVAPIQTGLLKGLADWMTASTNANITKLVNGET